MKLARIGLLFALIACGLGTAALSCSSDDTKQPETEPRTTDVNADCSAYCAAQEKAACSPPLAPGACVASCLRTVEAHGSCADVWRATMRCTARVGLTCTASGPRANGCATEYASYTKCVTELIEAGVDAGSRDD